MKNAIHGTINTYRGKAKQPSGSQVIQRAQTTFHLLESNGMATEANRLSKEMQLVEADISSLDKLSQVIEECIDAWRKSPAQRWAGAPGI